MDPYKYIYVIMHIASMYIQVYACTAGSQLDSIV